MSNCEKFSPESFTVREFCIFLEIYVLQRIINNDFNSTLVTRVAYLLFLMALPMATGAQASTTCLARHRHRTRE